VETPPSEDSRVVDLNDVTLEQLEEMEQLRLRKALLTERLAAAQALAVEREQRIADLRAALFIVRSPRRDVPAPGHPSNETEGSTRPLQGQLDAPSVNEAPELAEPVEQGEQVGQVEPVEPPARLILPGAYQPNGDPARESPDEPHEEQSSARNVEQTWNRELNTTLEGRIPWKLPDDAPRARWWVRLRERRGKLRY
jgi:hypothetical protein